MFNVRLGIIRPQIKEQTPFLNSQSCTVGANSQASAENVETLTLSLPVVSVNHDALLQQGTVSIKVDTPYFFSAGTMVLFLLSVA